jgi:response regulator NasT
MTQYLKPNVLSLRPKPGGTRKPSSRKAGARKEKVAEKPRVLIIEDDRGTAELLVTALTKAGYQPQCALSEGQALRIASEVRHDLALVNIDLPALGGIDLARRLSDELDVPFVFLGHHSDSTTVREATECGALGYLVKPLQVTQVLPCVVAAFAKAKQIRELRERASNLSAALEQGRETSIAIGLLMERHHVDREAAFEALRDEARARRCNVHELAGDVLAADELLNRFSRRFRPHAK